MKHYKLNIDDRAQAIVNHAQFPTLSNEEMLAELAHDFAKTILTQTSVEFDILYVLREGRGEQPRPIEFENIDWIQSFEKYLVTPRTKSQQNIHLNLISSVET